MIFGFWLNYPFNGVQTGVAVAVQREAIVSAVTLKVCHLYGDYKSSVLADVECAHNQAFNE